MDNSTGNNIDESKETNENMQQIGKSPDEKPETYKTPDEQLYGVETSDKTIGMSDDIEDATDYAVGDEPGDLKTTKSSEGSENSKTAEDMEASEDLGTVGDFEESDDLDVAKDLEESEDPDVAEGLEESEDPDVAENKTSFSDEELDNIADTAILVIQDIIKYFNVGEATIDEYEGDEGELILDITGKDMAILIGRHGKTLDALQVIVSSIASKKIGFRYPIVVDVESYKTRQRQKIETIARSVAERAVKQNKPIGLRAMTPYERRLVHLALKDNSKVYTESAGEGVDRHVVIYPR